MTYAFTTADPPTRILKITDDAIRPDRLREFAVAVEPDYRGTIADDTRNDFGPGQRASWQIELTIGDRCYAVTVVKLLLPAPLDVAVAPLEPLPAPCLPVFVGERKVREKHTMSQLSDLYVTHATPTHAAHRWVLAKHYDSCLLDLAPGDHFVMQGHRFVVQNDGSLAPTAS